MAAATRAERFVDEFNCEEDLISGSSQLVPQLKQMEQMLPNFKFMGELKRGAQHSDVFCGYVCSTVPGFE
jgi:hypothetical protein